MNPLSNPNQVFSHDAEKYIYQEPDMRMVNPALFTAKPFKVKPPEKSKKAKKDVNKNKSQGENKEPLSGFFDLF